MHCRKGEFMNDIIFLVLFFGSIVFLLGCFILGLALEKERVMGIGIGFAILIIFSCIKVGAEFYL